MGNIQKIRGVGVLLLYCEMYGYHVSGNRRVNQRISLYNVGNGLNLMYLGRFRKKKKKSATGVPCDDNCFTRIFTYLTPISAIIACF